MKVHSIEDGALRTAEPPDDELMRLGLLEKLTEGQAIFLDRWVFPGVLLTTRGMLPVELLELSQGVDRASGEPGSCDAHWFEARTLDGDLVKRAVNIIATGIERNTAGLS